MMLILKDYVGSICLVYIDDLLIFGKDREQHDENLAKVLKRMNEYGLQENKEKRGERTTSKFFLGFDISYTVVKPSVDRAQGIMNYAIPKTRKELHRFLGLVNYDRLFVKNMSHKIKAFYNLLKKDTKYVWTENETRLFHEVKNIWKERLELMIPDLKQSFCLESDASNIGIGAVLTQKNIPVEYISRLLTKAEKNYSITEKEVLAALWGMEKFQYYLYGRNFVLETDHQAIEEFKRKREFGSPRIARWFDRLERFQFTIKYKKGSELIGADALSRNNNCGYVFTDKDCLSAKVLKIHEEKNPRKTIMGDLVNNGIKISRYK